MVDPRIVESLEGDRYGAEMKRKWVDMSAARRLGVLDMELEVYRLPM